MVKFENETSLLNFKEVLKKDELRNIEKGKEE